MDHNPYNLKTLDEKPSGYLDSHQLINFLAKNKIPIKRMDNLPRFADQNKIEMKISDNSGRQISDSICPGLGDFQVNLPVNSWMNLPWAIDCEVSKDAGTFVCNETFYHSLKSLQTIGDKRTQCLFVHLPVEVKCTIEDASTFLGEILQRMFFR